MSVFADVTRASIGIQGQTDEEIEHFSNIPQNASTGVFDVHKYAHCVNPPKSKSQDAEFSGVCFDILGVLLKYRCRDSPIAIPSAVADGD